MPPDKQGTPEEGWRIQWPKCCVTTNNKNKDNRQEKKNPHKTLQSQSICFVSPSCLPALNNFSKG